jgi:hypothetical protein
MAWGTGKAENRRHGLQGRVFLVLGAAAIAGAVGAPAWMHLGELTVRWILTKG